MHCQQHLSMEEECKDRCGQTSLFHLSLFFTIRLCHTFLLQSSLPQTSLSLKAQHVISQLPLCPSPASFASFFQPSPIISAPIPNTSPLSLFFVSHPHIPPPPPNTPIPPSQLPSPHLSAPPIYLPPPPPPTPPPPPPPPHILPSYTSDPQGIYESTHVAIVHN